MTFEPRDRDYESKVRDSFSRQLAMQSIGSSLDLVLPGEVHISIPYDPAYTQQNGFMHAGIISTLADSACGYAAFSMMPAGSDVVSVEFKINLLAPAVGERFIAKARVIRSGKTLTVVRAEVFALKGDDSKQIAEMQATMMCLENKGA
jgi:uncharacterized protein (TIGR00369 family)